MKFTVPAGKRRNPYALDAKMRSGAGFHKHPAREESRNACRGRVSPDLINEDHEDVTWFFDEERHEEETGG